MPNPKQRKTISAKNQRRSHHALKQVKVATCEKCHSAKKPHYACPVCGFYNGNETKKEKKPAVTAKTAAKKSKAPAEKKSAKEKKEKVAK